MKTHSIAVCFHIFSSLAFASSPHAQEDAPGLEHCIPIALSSSNAKKITLYIDSEDGSCLPSRTILPKGFSIPPLSNEKLEGNKLKEDLLLDLGTVNDELPEKEENKEEEKGKKPLHWQVEDAAGNSYYLKIGTSVGVIGLKGIIPKDTELTESKDDPKKFTLPQDLSIPVKTQKNRRISLQVPNGTLAWLFPRSENTNAVFSVAPKKTVPGGTFNLTVKRDSFDFQNAKISLYLVQPGWPGFRHRLENVRMVTSKTGEASFEVCIPSDEDTWDLWGKKPTQKVRFSSYKANLLLVAQTVDGQVFSVVHPKLKVASPYTAMLAAIASLVFIWIVAIWITGCKKPTKENNRDYQETNSDFPASSTSPRNPAEKRWLNPIQFVSGKYGRASLSLAQIFLWTILVFASSCYILVARGELLPLTNVLALLGIAGTTSVFAKISSSSKADQGRKLTPSLAVPKYSMPEWKNLLQTGGKADLFKMQMALFTVVSAIYVVIRVVTHHEFPQLPEGFLTLMGISNGLYIGAKATNQPPIQDLVIKDQEREQAQKAVELAKEKLADAKERLANSKDKDKETITKEIGELTAYLNKANKDLKKATSEFEECLKSNGLKKISGNAG